jgi:hypothetical protein
MGEFDLIARFFTRPVRRAGAGFYAGAAVAVIDPAR